MTVPLILLLGALAACIYGLRTEHLFSQPIQVWMDEGVNRFLWFAGVYWAAANVILWRWPRQLLRIVVLFVLLYSAWWTGPVTVLATLYFLGSCYCLGRLLGAADKVLSLLLGAAAWMFLLWCALHFPINNPWTYGVAFLLPYVGQALNLRPPPRRPLEPPATPSATESAGEEAAG